MTAFEIKMFVSEQANYLYQNAFTSAAGQLALVLVIYTQLADSIRHELLLPWCLAITFLILIKITLTRFYKAIEPKNIKPWLDTFTLASLLIGLAWASFCLFYFVTSDANFHYIMVVIICVILAAAVPILGVWPPAFFSSTVPQFLTLSFVLSNFSSVNNYFFEAAFVIYFVTLILLQRNMYNSMKKAFVLKNKNDALVVKLNDEVAQREEVIEQRTNDLNSLLTEKNSVINNKLIGIAIAKGREVKWANSTFSTMFGYRQDEVVGMPTKDLYAHEKDYQAVGEMYKDLAKGVVVGDIEFKRKDGSQVWVSLRGSIFHEESDESLWVMADITDKKKAAEKLIFLAHYDALTGLPNRTLFSDRFHQAVAHSKRSRSELAICFLDLDDFKPINDSFGHKIGDRLLIEVANRIQSCIRSVDTVARLGGDEFALLLGDIVSFEQCEETVARIHQELAKPFFINDILHNITVSTGITLYPRDEGDADTLLRHADQAMYLAKQLGRNKFTVFNVEEEQRRTQENYRLAEINDALENDELCLYYQPKINMATGEVLGVEALLRWLSPEKGLIPPLDFLPILKGTNLEIKIGEWVIQSALAELESWQKQNINLEISVNVSSHHLMSINFIAYLEQALAKHPTVKANKLQLEVLESSVLSDIKAITYIIETCKTTLGVSFALDDFGTGYSSLTHLKNLPANLIKIDQTFVRDMLDDPYDYTIVDGVISLADAFGRDVIAEGVETKEQGLLLLLLGCEKGQGYGISKPLKKDEFLNWLNNYTPNQDWLDCDTQNLSRNEKQIKIFTLTSGQWVRRFIANLKLGGEEPKQWPIMDEYNNPCSHWLKREKKAKLFSREWLYKLQVSDKKLFVIAMSLFNYYQNGNYDQARQGIEEVERVFLDMVHILEQHE